MVSKFVKEWRKMEKEGYNFTLNLSTEERAKLEAICCHKDTTKALFLKKYINTKYDEIFEEVELI